MAHTPRHQNHQPRAEIMSEQLEEKAEEAAEQMPPKDDPATVPFTGNQQPPRWDPPPEHGDAA